MAQETPNPASLARAAETAAEQLERLTKAAKTADTAFGKVGRSAKSSFAAIDSAAARAEESIQQLTRAQRRASSQAAEYERRLSDLADALDPLAAAQDALAQSARALNEALKKGATGGDQYADMLNKLGTAAKESEAEIARYGGSLKDSGKYAEKFGSQMKDFASGLLSGQEPMALLTNLGVGMVETFAGAALEAGGLKAAFAGFGEAAVAFAPFAAIGAVAVGAFALFEREIDKNTKHATTWGDTWNALVKVTGDYIMNGPIGEGLGFLGDLFSKTLDFIVDGVTGWYDNTVGFFIAAYQTITKNWSNLPDAIGAIISAAANKTIGGIEAMINGVISGLNVLLKKAGLDEFGKVTLPRLQAANAKAAAAFSADWEKASARAKKSREGFGAAVAAQADREWEKRQKSSGSNKDHSAAPQVNEVNVVGLGDNIIEFTRDLERQIAAMGRSEEAQMALAYATARLGATTDDQLERLDRAYASWKAQKQLLTEAAAVRKTIDAQQNVDLIPMPVVHLEEHKRALGEIVEAYGRAFQSAHAFFGGVAEGNVGGSISGLSGLLKEAGQLAGGGLGQFLGSASGVLAPIGGAVSAVTGVLGAIGQKSAEKAQAKLEALKGAVDVLRTENKTSSGSIAGALEEANSAWNQDLEYSSAMVASLRSIDNQIGNLASGLSRSIAAGNLLSPSGLGLGTTTSNGSALFGLANLFLGGSKTTTELLDQGLSFNAASYADILANGISGATYADLVTTKTKKFLGVAYSTKVSTSTVSGAIDGDLLSQIAGVIQALGDGVLSAASVFGVEAAKAAEAALGSAVVDLGKLSLKDLSATEIAEVLNATFDKVADQLAAAGVQGLEDLAAVGEGAFETLTRLAREYQVVDTALASLGMSFRSIGIESLSARDNLVQLFGGLDAFSSATSFFASSFLTEAEQLAPVIGAVNDNLAAFGLSAKSSREEFKKVVLGLDVSTAAGAEAYKTLLSIAPAFDKVATASEDAASVLAQAAEEAASLRATQQSDAEALVSNARAALVSAYEAEASAIEETINKWSSLEETLRDARNALDETAGAAASYAALRAQARTTAASAALGDADAAGNLPDQITAFLESSANSSTSQANYLRDVAWAKSALAAAEATAGRQKTLAEQQLEALTAQVSALTTINESVLSVANAIAGLQSALKVLDGTYGGALANPDREWGVNRDVNMLLARQTGYAGDFGSGGFQAWIEQQPESVKKVARDILAAQNQSYRIGFANGGAFTNGVVTRPTAFNTAVMGEAGPEAIMPLTNIGGRLGVRAANDPRLVTALERLVAVNERQAEDIADLKASNEKLQRQFATVTSGGQAMMTEAA
ncbi:hypothetical protein [Caulobacter sp. BP25]|uniref:hypothetical protein n=1 Tax=Caulobacter sp. BP25 TaxID=2048900 RepID=UPI00117CE14F|nr:hypothetical protein [Caulobacter sp. BP25]